MNISSYCSWHKTWMQVMHHSPSCTHLWGINNSGVHSSPSCRNRVGLETLFEKLQRSSDWHNTRDDQETGLPEWAYFTEEQNATAKLIEFYWPVCHPALCYFNNIALQKLSIHRNGRCGVKVRQGEIIRELTGLELKTKFEKLMNKPQNAEAVF